RGDHHYIAARRGAVVPAGRRNPGRERIGPRNRPRFHHVQSFTSWRPIQNICQHHVSQLQVHNPLRRRRSHKPAAHHRHLFSTHPVLSSLSCSDLKLPIRDLAASNRPLVVSTNLSAAPRLRYLSAFLSYRATACPFIFSMIAPANAEVPNLVAPGINRSRS